MTKLSHCRYVILCICSIIALIKYQKRLRWTKDFSSHTHTNTHKHTHTHTHTHIYMHAYMLSRFSHVWLFVTLCTLASQAPLSMGFSRQEYWSGLLCVPPGDLPNQEMELVSLISPALAGRLFTTSATWETLVYLYTLFLYSFLLWFITGIKYSSLR